MSLSLNYYKQILLILIMESKYKFLFHKYHLNISNENDKIEYDIINISSNDIKYNFCHIHCFNLLDFNKIFDEYIYKINKRFNIILTWHKGEEILELIKAQYDFNILKVSNKGIDIGAKFCCVDFLNKNNIDYRAILFLHSKNDIRMRKKYFTPMIKNIKYISRMIYRKNIYGIFPNLTHKETGKIFENNELYLNELRDYFNIKNNNYLFAEGNVCILNKLIIDKIFLDKKLYNILNTESSYDHNWINFYYDDLDKDDIKKSYELWKNKNYYGNNILLRKNINEKQLADSMIEHVFERIYLTLIEECKGKYLLFNNKQHDFDLIIIKNKLEKYYEKINIKL